MFSAWLSMPPSVAKSVFYVNARDTAVSYRLRQFSPAKEIAAHAECDGQREITRSTGWPGRGSMYRKRLAKDGDDQARMLTPRG
jgi:hypothetical protein